MTTDPKTILARMKAQHIASRGSGELAAQLASRLSQSADLAPGGPPPQPAVTPLQAALAGIQSAASLEELRAACATARAYLAEQGATTAIALTQIAKAAEAQGDLIAESEIAAQLAAPEPEPEQGGPQ